MRNQVKAVASSATPVQSPAESAVAGNPATGAPLPVPGAVSPCVAGRTPPAVRWLRRYSIRPDAQVNNERFIVLSHTHDFANDKETDLPS